jgi:hypothetical protein
MKATSGKKSEYILGNQMIEPSEKTHYFWLKSDCG